LRWASDTGNASVACSADGKYVYVVGGEGILVSETLPGLTESETSS
jgi:hypothetical protein